MRIFIPGALTLICVMAYMAHANDGFSKVASTETSETEESGDDSWAYAGSTYAYFVPDDQNYVSAIFTADGNWLHLEGRYNYENIDAGSAWIGYNFSFGKKLTLDATPMFGGVFGSLNGVAPGWEVTISYSKLEFYTENEYVFDLEDRSGNFYYNWTELTYSPIDWLQVGLIVQRTKAYQTDLDIQRGFLVSFSYKSVQITTYVFDLGWEKPTVAVAAGLNF
jgi:hypothetical protein